MLGLLRRARVPARVLTAGMLAASLLAACAETPVAPRPAAAPSFAKGGNAAASPWQLANPAFSHEIEGYASAPSVNVGEPISLYVNTTRRFYTVDVYRMGWYNGAGAALAVSIGKVRGVAQAAPVVDPTTGLVECRWQSPVVVPGTALTQSGVYLAKLTADDGKDGYVIFVVRDDQRASKYLVQVSVNTYQAYNNWGGKSLYGFNSSGGQAAHKVSLNRPYGPGLNPNSSSGVGAGEFLTNVQPGNETAPAAWEYNMVRFLEREGYGADVTYTTDYDVHARPSTVLNHRAFLTVGHDEYWTMSQRNAIQTARDQGVNLGFFSANTGYWQVRFEPSLTGTPDRTMVGYKGDARDQDPVADKSLLTTLFRDPYVGRPENLLVGVMYGVDPINYDIVINDASTWVTSGTGLKTGDHLPGLLGYEIDFMTDSLPNMRRIGHSVYSPQAPGGDMTVYTASSGAIVFAAGSMQWAWGLDDYNANGVDGGPAIRPSLLSPAAQQMTRNVLNAFTGARLAAQ